MSSLGRLISIIGMVLLFILIFEALISERHLISFNTLNNNLETLFRNPVPAHTNITSFITTVY